MSRSDLHEHHGDPQRAALAAWVGSALEYYDFFIYGTAAALVFGKVFFPDSSAAAGTLLALATFGVGYLARPVGALVLGHLGDRIGRRRILLATVVLMGVTTFAVGCLPGYRSIGVAAPVLLVALRLLQGFSAGGEQAGANSMTLEHAPGHRRAFFTSFTLSGTQGGQILATAVFLPIAALPKDSLLSWGWRIPFWASAIVVAVALLIRRTVEETPVFEQESVRAKVPAVELFRNHTPAVLRVVCAATVASVSTIFTVYALSYAVNTVGISKTAMLWVGVGANVVALAAIPAAATLSDRIGRKPVFVTGALGSGVMMFVYLAAIDSRSLPLIAVAGVAMFGLVYSAANAVWPSLYGEMFPTRVRYSGTAIGTQIGFAVAGFAPTIAGSLAGPDGTRWVPVALLALGFSVLSSIAVLTAKETFRVPTAELGLPHQRAPRGEASALDLRVASGDTVRAGRR